MDENRKRAYQFLVYECLILMRMSSGHQFSWWNPKSWNKDDKKLRRIQYLANAFHNLALYSSRDMEGFDEKVFWDLIERYNKQYPKMVDWMDFKQIFQERLNHRDS